MNPPRWVRRRDGVELSRSRDFRGRAHDRYWWYTLDDTDYVPSIYASLTDREWRLLESWFAETEAARHVGEINVPAMCMIHGLISGGGLRRVVQLGHYYGYSTLLIGFLLRAMNARPGLFTIDVDPDASAFTERWVRRAGLEDWVSVFVGDSAAESSLRAATETLGGPPQLVLLDSSHRYDHTLEELDLWVPRLTRGAIMLLHDTSRLAQQWDPSASGGVLRAIDEWLAGHRDVAFLNLNGFAHAGDDANALVYKDGCGLGILQKL
jgi:predicted O-methyltransferase YrrM